MRDVHDTLSWVCFCLLIGEKRIFSDLQISVLLHTELKQVRSALTRLWNDNLIVRTNASGFWRVDVDICRSHVVKKLRAIADSEKLVYSEDKNCLCCPDCGIEFDVDSTHVIDALMMGNEPRCHCGAELCKPPQKDDISAFVNSRLHAIQVITTSASSEPNT